MTMMTENLSEDTKEYLHRLERKIAQIEKTLEKERTEKEASRKLNENLTRENKKLKEVTKNVKKVNKNLRRENKQLKKELARLLSSAPVLAGSDKTAEAGGIPSSKIFYKRNRQEGTKRRTGGQPGHPGHARKKPTPNSPSISITLETCPGCASSLGKPTPGSEQKRTVTDIPLPSHIVYEIVFPRYWCKECKKMVRGEAHWLPPNQ